IADLAAENFEMSGSIPELSFAAFQATFAGITCALIVGGLAERVRYSAVLVFTPIWVKFDHVPIAQMGWGVGGWLFERGAVDVAGGTVVHSRAGVAALVGAWVVGKRLGHGKEAMQPHNLPMAMIGASLLWVGWFGFTAGSALRASGSMALAFFNPLLATS